MKTELVSLKNLISFEFLNKFGLCSLEEKIGLEKIVINISIRDQIYEYSSTYPRSLLLLEHISSRRSYIRSYASKMRGRKSTYCTLQVSMRKANVFNFFIFLNNFVESKIKKKALLLNEVLNENLLSFEIEEAGVFPGIEEDFLNWRYSLGFNLLFNVSKNYELSSDESILIGRNYNIYLFGGINE